MCSTRWAPLTFLHVMALFVLPLRSAPIGTADGGFESGFAGMTTAGDARVVNRLGVLAPPQGARAALLTTAPDAGSEPGDASVATVIFHGISIPVGAPQLRFQSVFLTDEPTPSLTNDRLSVVVRNQSTLAEMTTRILDTFGPYYAAPWTGYAEMTGWQGIAVDLSALAGSPDLFEVEFRIEDVGDGRHNSAALLDDVRLVAGGLPTADAGFDYLETTVGASIPVNGLGSADDGTIVEYLWDFGDGTTATGPVGAYAYSRNGIFQGSLTVTDNDGNRDTDAFTVVIGGTNHAPAIVSEAVTAAVELRAYRYDVDTTDSESMFGDTVTYSLDTAPAQMTIDAASGVITWRPTALSARSNPVTVRATDSRGLSTTQSFTITVVEPTAFIVVTDDGGYIYTAESNGNGGWTNWRYVSYLSGSPRGAAIADFTGDGALDFVTGSVYSGNTLTLFLYVNDGTNHFRNAGPVLTATGVSWPYGVAEGDFNRDGRMDLAVSGDSTYLLFAWGNGRGGFTPQTLNTGRGNGRGLDAADFDHDGDLDLVRGTTDSKVYLWRNDGAGGFTEWTFVGTRGDPYPVVAGDFNNDGNPDVIAGNSSSGDANFYAGQGDGTFAAPIAVPSLDFNNHGSYDDYDFNGDGNNDIIAVTYSTRQVYYYAGNGDGTFRSAVRVNTFDTWYNCLGVAAPTGPPPAGAPLAVIDPNPAIDTPGATITFSGARSIMSAGGTWWNAAWPKRQALLVSNQARAAQQDVQIRLRVPYAAGMANDFGDLRFADQAGNPVSYWVESQTDGVEVFVWLLLPRLTADATNAFFLYFGNAGATSESNAPAVFDEPGISTGADGTLDVTALGTTVNACTWLTADTDAGTLSLPVADGTAFANGDTVLVIQMQNGSDGQAGYYEYATVTGGGGTPLLTLSAGLANSYRSGTFDAAEAQVAQVVRVPNYTGVTVRANASLTAPLWDGKCGGVLAFFAADTVTVEADGLIHADACGFRGTDPHTTIYRNATGQQGESSVGRGVMSFAANGCGGGGGEGRGTSGSDAAGAGGGGYGTSGATAANYGNSDGGGGGGVIGEVGLARVFLGGGGGEGGADEDGGRPGNGGRGGGIILVRAARVAIDGTVRSNGANGGNGSNDVGGGGCGMGGGGGGAGGSILLDAVISGAGSLAALGGSGGSSNGCGSAGAAAGQGRICFSGAGFAIASSPSAAVLGLSLLATQDSGAETGYAWYFSDGTTATGVGATHTFPDAEGDYAVRLTVTDPLGRSDSEVGLVRLLGDPPLADAGGPYVFDERYAVGGVWTVALDGSGSQDDGGAPLTYAWRLGNNLNETFDQLGPDGMPLLGLWTWSTGVSISGGAASIVGAGAWNNRYLGTVVQYPRVVGQSFRTRVLRTSGSEAMWGLKSTNDDFNYPQLYYAFYFVGSEIRIYEGNNNRGRVASFASNVSYDLRIDVDYFGARYYVRQTGQPAWTLVYESAYSSASPFRIAATVASGTFLFDDWTVSDSESALANPTVMYPRQGTYNVSLTVTDSVLQEGSDATTVTLVAGALPTANPGGPYVIPESAANCDNWTVQLDGSLSSDPEGALRADGLSGIYRYAWDFGDGSSGTGQKPTHTFAGGGVYTVTLTVWDHALQTASAQTTVTTQPGALPVARPGGPYAVDEHAALAGLWTVNFDGSASSDDVGLCSYSWDFGDGSPLGSGATPTHQYAAVGTYTVVLTVRDHALQEHQDSTTVTVSVNDPPVPDPAGPYVVDERYAHNGSWTYTFDGSASSDDFGIWTYAWDFGETAAMAFDGNGDDAVVVPDAPALRPAQLTVAAWVYPVSFPSWATVLMKSSNSSFADGYGIVHTTGSNDLRFFINRYNATYVETTIPLASWSFVTGTFDGAHLRLYINGDLVAIAPGPAITHTNGNLEIGNGSGGNYPWNGQIDDVSLWDRALTLAEIRALMAEPPTPPAANLVAFWDFDDGTGADHSGNGYDGTLAGNATPARSAGTGVAPTHVFSRTGTFEAALTVTDNGRQVRTATTQVTVRGNELPVADAGGDLVTEVGMPVTLDASRSSDDFGIWKYEWDLGLDAPWWVSGGGSEHGDAFVYGVGSWDNRYLVSQTPFTRVSGASFTGTLMVSGNRTSGNRDVMWGLHNSDTSSFSYNRFTHAIYFTGGKVRIYENSSDLGQRGTYTDSVPYECRIDLKAAGAVYYLRQLGAANWTQIHETSSRTDSPLYPGLTVLWGTVRAADFTGPDGPIPLPPSRFTKDKKLSAKYSVPGTYQAVVTVTDHARQIDTASATVTVVQGRPPVANAGGPYTTSQDVPTRFNGRGSQDDFGIAWYLWDFGDGTSLLTRNPWVDHRYAAAGPYTAALTCIDYAGQRSTDTTNVSVNNHPVVACVPWQFQGGNESPHDLVDGRQTRLKGVCWSLDNDLQYKWDFGDGTGTDFAAVTNKRMIDATHTYSGTEGQPFIATLTVRDSLGQQASDVYLMRIRAPSLDIDINIAIDEGLWWLHGAQSRATYATGTYGGAPIDYGYWSNTNGSGDNHSVTGSSVQSFMVNGHLELGDVREDPYVETVTRSLHWLGAALRSMEIGVQTSGDPDTDHDSLAVEVATDNPIYRSGPVLDAICATSSAGTYAITGPVGLIHQSYSDIAREMVDAFCWGQSDPGQWGVGGWRYGWNTGESDNSAAQWAAIGLFAAEHVFRIEIPDWVRDNNQVWLNNSYDSRGGFGYTGVGYGDRELTPSGMVQLAFVRAVAHDASSTPEDDRDTRWKTCENYMANNWNTSFWLYNTTGFSYYGYYAFTKAARLAYPAPVETLKATGLNWFRDETNGIARRIMRRQNAAGHFARDSEPSGWIGEELTQSWAILMLSPTLFVQPPVADAGEDRVWGARSTLYPVFPDLTLDGSRSYHLDPFRRVVLYEWDVDGDGIYETRSAADATVTIRFTTEGMFVVNSDGSTTPTSAGLTFPTAALPRNVTAVLRVTDNNDPAISDTDSLVVTVAEPPHAPVAVAGGPYHARVGVPITLDGGDSFDIDPGDTITAWEWEVGSDNLFDDLSGALVQHTFTETGVFNVGLRVWDNAVLSDQNGNGTLGEPEDRLSDTAFAVVYVTDNSAPVLNKNGELRFTPISEDSVDPAGDLIAAVLLSDAGTVDNAITDADDDPEGIAVTGLTQRDRGTWQYKPADTGDWLAFPDDISITQAVLLTDGSRIRYVPDLAYNNGHTASIAFQAWDRTSGSNGQTGVDVSVAGGATAFSLTVETADLLVADVNDAPAVTAGTDLRLTPINEDDTAPPGDTVQDVLGSDPGSLNAITDPDFGAVEGIAVIGLTGNTTGTWQFRLAGAPAWTNFGAVSDSAAVLLPSDARLRFLPDLAFNNGQTVTLTFRAWDMTTGAPGAEGVEATANGGTTAFSAGTDEAQLVVAPVNDAPVLDPAGALVLSLAASPDSPGDTVAAILASDPVGLPDPVADPDEGAVAGIAVIGLTGGDLGTWQFRRAADSTWQDFGAVSESAATLLADDASVRFLPGPDFFGTTAVLTFRAWDQTSGSEGDTDADTTANGGTTAFSAASDMAVLLAPERPDLVLDEVDARLVITPCGSLDSSGTVTALVRNAGASATDNAATVLFFEDRNLNGLYDVGDDALLGSGTLAAGLAPAASATVSATVVGTVLFAGNRIYAVADAGDAVQEIDETNNTGYSRAACEVPVKSSGDPQVKEATGVPAADLTASYLRLALVHRPLDIHLIARVGNGGAAAAAAPVMLAFYDGDPETGGSLIGVGQTTVALPPGTYEDVAIAAPATFVGLRTVFVRADDDGHGSSAVAECDEANNSCSVEMTIVPNRAPVLDPVAALVFGAITEDTASPAGDTVQAVLASDPGGVPVPITDADGDPLGIAVIGLTQADRGTWQYALDGGPWLDIGTVTPTSALLLDAGAHLRFVPDLAYNNGHTASLTYRAWDQTAGIAGQTGVDVSVTGGYTAFSTATDSVPLVVQDVNDAPVLDPAGNLVLTSITEDDTDPPGDTVTAMLASDAAVPVPITDPDFGALTGIAVIGLTDSDKGTWQQRLAGAPTWTAFPAVSENAALLLPADARVRYLPLLSYNNGHTATLTFRAWDRSTGTVGSTADTAANGATTAFSTVVETVALGILDVNDAPILGNTGVLTAPETAVGDSDPPGFSVQSVLTSGAPSDGISDPDIGAAKGIAVSAFGSLRDGRWQFRLVGDSAWRDVPAVSPAAALLLPPDAELRFVPPTSLAGDHMLTVEFRAWDHTVGAAGTTAASTPNGGTTAFSAATHTFVLLVRGSDEVTDNWWYPSFSWEPLAADGTAKPYGWYHVQVFAADDLTEPYFEANVHGTAMTASEYFLAAFDGFPGGLWLWRYRGWDPATDRYGPFTPASLDGVPDPAYVLDLDYGPATVPTGLSWTGTAPGIYLLRFLVGNARAYEVQIVHTTNGQVRTWRHAFIPGEDPDKQQGTPPTFGLDNPPMVPPLLIPRDEPATLAVNLPRTGVYRVYIRGFNPTDERDGLPPFTEFPDPITVRSRQPALSPPQATGLIPGGSDLIAIPGSAAVMPHRLQWDPMPGAQRFVLYLAAANASPLFNFEDIGNTTRLDVALPPGSYTWQVVGLNDEGAVPTAGRWSAAEHFEVVRSIAAPAVVTDPRLIDATGVRLSRVERLSPTRIRISWAGGGAAPDLIEVRHYCSGMPGWVSYAPRALLDVDNTAGTGVFETADLARSGTHHVLLRAYVGTPDGSYLRGEPRFFTVPRLSGPSARTAGRRN